MFISCQLYKSSFIAPLAHWRGVQRGEGSRYPPLKMAKIEPLIRPTQYVYPVAMPRPVRSTRNTRVNYAESVCSADSDNDSDYSPDDRSTSVSSVQQEGTRRSSRLRERAATTKPVVKRSSRS